MILHADLDGERLDAFLARTVENLSRSGAQKLLEDGCVLRNGKPGRKNDKLNISDEVAVTLPEPKEVDIVAREMPLDIVYEDTDVLVINKPKGLVVHPAAGHQDDTLGSTASCARASCTALTRRPPAFWRWRKTILPTQCWPPS